LYNETRVIVISLFKKIDRLIAKDNEMLTNPDESAAAEESSDEDDIERIPDFFIIEDQNFQSLGTPNEEQ
jgi:hypothetical protein